MKNNLEIYRKGIDGVAILPQNFENSVFVSKGCTPSLETKVFVLKLNRKECQNLGVADFPPISVL